MAATKLPAFSYPQRVLSLWIFAVLPGTATLLVSAYFLRLDFAALQRTWKEFELAATTGGSQEVTVANAFQMTYRINCFADGVGVLLGAILLAIGVLGLCLLEEKREEVASNKP
jgi:hypothetical protein